jgi:FMN phosphatase YigB (HAD superfamily)
MLDLSPSVEVVSFDVFDTVVARNVYHPQDLYLRIQDRLADIGNLDNQCKSLRNFSLNRTAAEQKAREQLTDREEVTLDEIVSVLAEQYGFPPESIEAIAACEIEEEIRSVVPVGPIVSLVRELRQAGKKIVFVSDMYLPDMVIRGMLQRVGAMEADDGLYVSGSVGKKKSTGSLFCFVLDDLKIQPNQLTHVGDYLWSDYLIPRWKVGIRSVPVRIARNDRYEQIMGEACGCIYCSSFAGASRAGRVALERADSTVESVLNEIGSNVVGPIITGFILYTLQQASQEGIKRLYFLSRDGETMLEVACELAARLKIDIQLSYLYVSRTAVFPALVRNSTEHAKLDWVKEDNILLTLRIIADRLKLNVNRLMDGMLRIGVALHDPDKQLSRGEFEKISSALLTDSHLLQMVYESGDHAFSSLKGYLEQEGVFDGTKIGLVDLGWHGSIQDVIHELFADRLGFNGISGYYFGVDRQGSPSNRKYGFVFNHNVAAGFAKYKNLFRVLMEVLCSGREGMVLGYNKNSLEQYEPTLGAIEHPENSKRVEYIRCGVRSFLSCLDLTGISGIDIKHTRGQILNVLKMLFFFPSRGEAVALGDLRFSADQAGHGINYFAQQFTFISVLSFLSKGNYAGRSMFSSWFFASWMRANFTLRLLLLPVVFLIRAYYLRVEMILFVKLKAIDFINNRLNGLK